MAERAEIIAACETEHSQQDGITAGGEGTDRWRDGITFQEERAA